MSHRPTGLRRLPGCRRGASAVEFALVALPLMVLIVGSIDLGRALYIRNDLFRAADVGARRILLDPDVADAAVADAVRGAFLAADPGPMVVTMGSETADGIDFRTIEVGYPLDLLAPVPGVDRITLGGSRRVPLE